MAFIKLTKSQNIIDNIHKIQQGDLLYIRVPKSKNPIWHKCFIYGTALGVEHNASVNSTCVYFLAESIVYMACFHSIIPKFNRRFPDAKRNKTTKLAWIKTYKDYFDRQSLPKYFTSSFAFKGINL